MAGQLLPLVPAAGFGRRRLLAAALAAPSFAALLTACGDDTKGAGSNPDTTAGDTTPGDTTPGTAGVGIEHPTGADDVMLRLSYPGGLVPPGYAFTNVPTLLISGDGRVFTPGLTTMIHPGPLLPAINMRTITEAGIQRVLALADSAALLQTPPDYHAEVNVADVPDTQLIISAKGDTFIHQANALGYQDPAETKARNVLNGVVIQLRDLVAVAGTENLGADAPLVAESYRMQARVVTTAELAGYTDEPKPTIVPWPDTVGVALADAAECVLVPAAAAGTLFSDANQLTFFSEAAGGDAVVYSVAVVAVLPGDSC